MNGKINSNHVKFESIPKIEKKNIKKCSNPDDIIFMEISLKRKKHRAHNNFTIENSFGQIDSETIS